MEPVITPAQMAAIDAEAPEPVEVLIERAGRAVAGAAVDLLGGRYGRRVLVIAGRGNNGNDGRVAARILERWGVRCTVIAPGDPVPTGHRFDLVVDAAYGTGFRGTFEPPEVGDVPVLAVDIPSGVDGLTGRVGGRALAAAATVTFAAPKPGLLVGDGRRLAGRVTVADIGLDCSRARVHHLGPDDVAARWPAADHDGHKWQRAVWVIGGQPRMLGAPALAATAAGRAGAGYVTVSVPGADQVGPPFPTESVFHPLGRRPGRAGYRDPARWASAVVDGSGRHGAVVIGPGLATDAATGASVRAVIAGTGSTGLVLDGGALDALVDPVEGGLRADAPSLLGGREVPAVLTPHDGELARLLGHRPGDDRIGEVRALAARLGAVVLAKGPTTVAAHPDATALLSTAGDERLATAGTGDVLAGVVGAALAGGLDPLSAAGLGAELHGRAARLGRAAGFQAGDLPLLVADWLDAHRS